MLKSTLLTRPQTLMVTIFAMAPLSCSTEETRNHRVQSNMEKSTDDPNKPIMPNSQDAIASELGELEVKIVTSYIKRDSSLHTNTKTLQLEITPNNPAEELQIRVHRSAIGGANPIFEKNFSSNTVDFAYDFTEQDVYDFKISSTLTQDSVDLTIIYDSEVSLDFSGVELEVGFSAFAKDTRELFLRSATPFTEDLSCLANTGSETPPLGEFLLARSSVSSALQLSNTVPSEIEVTLTCSDQLGNQAVSESIALNEIWNQKIDLQIDMIEKQSKEEFFYELKGENRLFSLEEEVVKSLIERNKRDLVMYFHYDPTINLEAPDTNNIFWAQEYSNAWSIPYPATLNTSVYISLIRSNARPTYPSTIIDTQKVELPK